LVQAIQAETVAPAEIAAVFESRRKRVGPKTQKIHHSMDKRFFTWLHQRHPQAIVISDIDRSSVRAFLTEIADCQEARTYNGYLRHLRTVFNSAVKDGYAYQNPTAEIEFLPEQESCRRAYTDEELAKLFSVVSGDVKLLTTMGLYAGAMRLSDIVDLSWLNIDLKAGTIRWRMQKRRGKQMEMAIHPRLKRELLAQGKHNAGDPVFLRFHGRTYRASEAFRKALLDAGLRKDTRPDNNRRYKRRRKDRATAEKEGREYVPEVTRKRPKHELDFHALRYNFVSNLKKQGCPEAIARSIVGHASKEVSQIYTQIDDESERKWVTSLPDLVSGKT